MNTRELELAIQKLIKFGKAKEEIVSILHDESKGSSDPMLLEEMTNRVCDNYPNFELIQLVMRSKLISDKDGESDKIIILNTYEQIEVTIDKSRLAELLDPKVDLRPQKYTCKFVYNPVEPFKLRKGDYSWEYNQYTPPFWTKDYFYSGGKIEIEKVDELPKIYKKFFCHLYDNDERSINYALDWLAVALQERKNFCFLTAIGKQGIGKGVQGEIMRLLVGSSNFAPVRKTFLTKDFNGQVRNKRIVYVDEVKITNVDQSNKLKAMANDTIEIEAKGVDAASYDNYASLYFSANELDAVPIPADDRRFSIVELTTKKLIYAMKKEEIAELLEPDNIEKLGRYLMHRTYDKQKMMEVFISARRETIRAAGLADWHDWFLDEYCVENPGKEIPINDLKEMVVAEHGSRTAPGRKAFQALEEKYPERFQVKNVVPKAGGRRRWHVIIAKEQP